MGIGDILARGDDMRRNLGWGTKVLLIPLGLVAALLLVPVPTSLGDGTQENIVQSWQGRYDMLTHQYYCRFWLENGAPEDVASTPFPKRRLVFTEGAEFRATALDLPGVVERAYRLHPLLVEQDLGTHNNVAGFLRPFPGRPVAFSEMLVKALAQKGWNPKSVGGPNIPPSSDWRRMNGQSLQIDTLTDNNVLRQLYPRQMPLPLPALLQFRRR